MTRRITLLFSAFEAFLVVAIGVAIPLLPATVLWAVHFGFAPDWAGFWRGAVDVWLIGHGVDVTFTLDEVTAASIGAPAGTAVLVSIAALGFGLLTLLLGVRAGSRIAEPWRVAFPILDDMVVLYVRPFGSTTHYAVQGMKKDGSPIERIIERHAFDRANANPTWFVEIEDKTAPKAVIHGISPAETL